MKKIEEWVWKGKQKTPGTLTKQKGSLCDQKDLVRTSLIAIVMLLCNYLLVYFSPLLCYKLLDKQEMCIFFLNNLCNPVAYHMSDMQWTLNKILPK